LGGENEGQRAPIRRVVAASFIGNLIEQYDFLLFGSMAALVFNQLFFPEFDPLVGTLAAFATFGVGFIARPLGGVLCGHYGDKIGRKAMLVLTLLVAGIVTFLMGLLPTYASVGAWAPVALVTLRFIQGLAYGGEFGGAVLMASEYAPRGKRGFYAGWVAGGAPAGLALATAAVLLSSTLSGEQFLAWGWRVPFLFSIVLVGAGLFIRLRVLETPVFARVKESGNVARMPVLELLRNNFKNVLLAAGLNFGQLAFLYFLVVFMLSYATGQLGLPRGAILGAVLVGMVVNFAGILAFGALSDRVGRRPVMLGGTLLLVLLSFPFFWMVETGDVELVWAAILIGSFVHSAVAGPIAALLSELFGTRVRYSGASLGYQFGAVAGGGFSPFIATALLGWSRGDPWSVALYSCAVLLVSALSIYLLSETYRNDLTEDPETSQSRNLFTEDTTAQRSAGST
jgi:MFS family permease